MYIKKKDKELFQELDKSLKVPSKWKRFVDKQKIYHNLIIKTKDKYLCTNCKTEFISNKKVNELCKCPNCKQEYLIKSNKLREYRFEDYLAIFDRVDNYFVERVFLLRSYYSKEGIRNYCFEWGRNIYNDSFQTLHQIVNDNVIGTTSGYWITYKSDFDSKWRYNNSYYGSVYYADAYIYYPDNLKKILGNIEEYKYSNLWILVKNVSYCDLIYLLKNYNYSVELLIKMKLYNLALNPKHLSNKTTFDKRFMGLSKDYLPFIVKHNLNIDELEILSLIKKKKISLIKDVSKIGNYKHLINIINFEKAFKLTDLNENNYIEYEDYLAMIEKMKMDMKNPRNLYPPRIIAAHDKAANEYKIITDHVIDSKIQKRYNLLKKNTFEKGKFVIFPAGSIEDLEEESAQQDNCVRSYAEKIADNQSDIYFMRLAADKEHSLVTVEVKNKSIVQKRTKNNEITTKEQDRFLKYWEEKILNG